MESGFTRTSLRNGHNLYVSRTDKFKTISIKVLMQQPLERERVSLNAVLPRVLKRGTSTYPGLRQLASRLEELYGARLLSDLAKAGDRQVMVFGLDLVAGHFVGRGYDLIEEGLAVLNELLLAPALVDGKFSTPYVAQEKDGLKRQIRALMNDKAQYSMIRCISEMFKNESFGLHHYGTVEGAEAITSEALFEHYTHVINTAPLDVFVVGDISPDVARSVLDQSLALPTGDRRPVPSMVAGPVTWEPRELREAQPVQQGKLTMGFRTGVTFGDDEVFPTIVFEGILGGFSHSKLFLNVREREGLAYYAQSMLDNSKGIMLVIAGIEPDKCEKAVDVIKQQIEDVKAGKFTEDDLESTRRSLMHRIRASEDSASSKISIFYEYALAGNPRNLDDRLRAIERVTRDQVVDAAHRVQLDLTYFVSPETGA